MLVSKEKMVWDIDSFHNAVVFMAKKNLGKGQSRTSGWQRRVLIKPPFGEFYFCELEY